MKNTEAKKAIIPSKAELSNYHNDMQICIW